MEGLESDDDDDDELECWLSELEVEVEKVIRLLPIDESDVEVEFGNGLFPILGE